MSDFHARRDLQAVTAFTAANSLFSFEFEADQQHLLNESGVVIEYSFDGINVHGRLEPLASAPSNERTILNHCRRKIWLRSVTPVGATMVQVDAYSR